MLRKAKFVVDIDKLKEDNNIPKDCEIANIKVDQYGGIKFDVYTTEEYENTIPVNEIDRCQEYMSIRSLGEKKVDENEFVNALVQLRKDVDELFKFKEEQTLDVEKFAEEFIKKIKLRKQASF